ncbi:hypothetical protein GWK08_15895 [Leptobacterium flavescens]|uniref:DUF664 domain-containing protein n=1 Tax=Leptobacterium flavescens TaxID=472055 RepID=A0A6P0USZ0_9FLAO|nr:hypothetical protein [Leptobacterium flavescens]NER14939.1 hypothetical protein [Leptobacterium flavescens]
MTDLPYSSIPHVPDEINASNVIARFVDGLGFRYYWATEGLTEKELEFRPCESSMNILEVLKHIHILASTANRTLGGGSELEGTPASFEAMRRSTLELYTELSNRLKKMDCEELSSFKARRSHSKTEYPFWFVLNGHISDALTHVGQVKSWRRMAGNPLPEGVQVFSGERVINTTSNLKK